MDEKSVCVDLSALRFVQDNRNRKQEIKCKVTGSGSGTCLYSWIRPSPNPDDLVQTFSGVSRCWHASNAPIKELSVDFRQCKWKYLYFCTIHICYFPIQTVSVNYNHFTRSKLCSQTHFQYCIFHSIFAPLNGLL